MVLDMDSGKSLPAGNRKRGRLRNERPIMSDSNSDLAELRAEVAALRGALALLLSGFHERTNLGSHDDWNSGAMLRAAAELTGQTDNPQFAEAFERLRAAVLSLPSTLESR
jgi:Ser/Thr protein kinase RdoA (MazF antagonist)